MKKIVFMGTPDFAVPVLNQLIQDQYDVVLVVTQPDRPKGRKKTLTPPPVKVEAEKHGIPVFQPEKIKDGYDQVLSHKPDLIVTAAFGQILPKGLLEAPPYGCVNVHASLLPKLRGGAPIHYAILQGDKETGVSIMYMVEKLDAGDILTQTKVAIEDNDHVGSLHEKLSEAGAGLLRHTLPLLFNNELTPITQNEADVSFASTIKRDQERIDWTRSSKTIYNQIRGLHPWPVAFTTYQGSVWKIWWGELAQHDLEGEPGEIIRLAEDGIVVACGGSGKGIKITSLQPAGKKRMSTEDFLRGTGGKVQIGDKLGVQDE